MGPFRRAFFDFGFEGGGAQYGQSFDNYGRKFGCSNSDHLQYWVYDDKYANRNPYYQMPPARQSIAVDGGAAEVFRLSPDEPWRIIRTRYFSPVLAAVLLLPHWHLERDALSGTIAEGNWN